MSFHVGQTFGDYSITAVVGAGAIGRVFKVEHVLTRRTEAMKVLSAELASDVQIKRFEREMRTLSRLSHPNIATLHNAIHSENQLILLMEFITGQTLEAMFTAGRLPLDEGVGYIKQVLSALGYAHQQGVVHRDISPANVMVMPNGQVKLTDFGLSKSYSDSLLTNCGEILGSLPYMAPEQLDSSTQPDPRSDLYSVGAILFEHLTGQKPFGENRQLGQVLADSENQPQAPSQVQPGLPSQWDSILLRALARDPARRYQSAEGFLEAIVQLERPVMAELPLPRLRTLGIGIAAFAALILAVIASPALRALRQVPPATVPWERLHIPPPAVEPASAASIPAEPIARTQQRAAKSTYLKKPVQRDVNPDAANAAASTPAPASAPAPLPAAETQQPEVQPSPPPAKRSFWSKLNVFRKKRSDVSKAQ